MTKECITKKIEKLTAELGEVVSPLHVTTDPYEIEAATGDLSILPKYHYKFKEEHIATHVVRPKDTEELAKVMKICKNYDQNVTVRAAGTSCYSSSTPTKGGVVIDVRRMNKIHEIDEEKKIVKCGAGISWIRLISSLRAKGLAPKCYPTSYKSSCLSGFVLTSGKAGIGTVKYGPMFDALIAIKLVKPDGSIVRITKTRGGEITLNDVVGSFGILGAVAEVEMKVTTLKPSMEFAGYGFNTMPEAMEFYNAAKNNPVDKPFFLSLSDHKFEELSHVTIPARDFFVYVVFYDELEKTGKAIANLTEKAKNSNGLAIDHWYLEEKWRDIAETELNLGRLCNNPIFQEYWIADERIPQFYETYAPIVKDDKYRNAFYMIAGANGKSRIKLFGLSDIENSLEFFGIKANFNLMAQKSYKMGDGIYTVGVVNTFYQLLFNMERVKYMRKLKNSVDPDDRINSYRITKTKMRLWRVKLLFFIGKLLYRWA
ncbi:MAG: FAD-binding oxidoreductase [Candidatus Lokiarchaeota archaeon]|nr:FAD-binding oxidoreductase [Candidatus Lokiarchaeota archaeon]